MSLFSYVVLSKSQLEEEFTFYNCNMAEIIGDVGFLLRPKKNPKIVSVQIILYIYIYIVKNIIYFH